MDGWMDRKSRSLPFTRLITRYGRKREKKMEENDESRALCPLSSRSCILLRVWVDIVLDWTMRKGKDPSGSVEKRDRVGREERGQELQSTRSCLDPGSIDSICWSRRDGKGGHFLLMPAAEFASLSVSLPSISFMFCVSSHYFDNILNHPPL